MKERQALGKEILLCTESDGVRFTRTFHIVKKVSEGTFSLCYEAYHAKSRRGILKEFYPRQAAAWLVRDARGQLVFPEGREAAKAVFARQLQQYIEPYQALLLAGRQETDPELASFIPAFEIYYGCEEDGTINGTAYIWTTQRSLETFDKLCEEIHRHPDQAPGQKMITALRAIESLTKCICMLHKAGMVHRDIKPSNFGFLRRGEEVLTQTLSMFDVDSICSVYDPPETIMGTEGFLEPEAAYERPSNQTDIYAIGATLFFAVAGSAQVRGSAYRYREDYYGRLRDLVNLSDLVCACEANAHPRLRDALTRILERSLCPRKNRYRCCEEMLEDLETALYYALPSEIARRMKKGEKWVLQEAGRELDRDKEKNSGLAIRYHLYRHPLYRCLAPDEEKLQVLVAGFGSYGQKFLDSCLQVGQMRGKRLSVTVLSDDPTDRDLYLKERPELADFFDIDGSLPEDEDSYGRIRFCEMHFSRENGKENVRLLQDYLIDRYESARPHYIFVALGEDALNLSAASACREAASVLDFSCLVSCVCENDYFPARKHPGVLPVLVSTDRKKDPLYPEIERMAFNCHLVWEKNLNVDFRSVKSDFLHPYNHDACVSSVLSLKYKLYSLGIDLEEVGPEEAAVLAEARGLASGKKNNTEKNELIWLEHRRWVTEKLCLGWRRIRDLEDCMGGVTRDEAKKRHVCIVRSRPDQMLAAVFCRNGNFEKWDTATESELEALDGLDRMSVDLHRAYAARAARIRKQNLLSGSIMQSIQALLEGSRPAQLAFREWQCCLQDIWNGDRGKERLYKGLREDFLEAAAGLPETARQSLREQVKAFETLFDPVRLSIQYRDYKQEDVALIENIPFILTYTENVYLAIPLATGESTEVFQNVAAATVVNPARILYLFRAEKRQEAKALLETLPYLLGYMKKKELRAEVELILSFAFSLSGEEEEEFVAKAKKLVGRKLCRVRILSAADTGEYLAMLRTYLRQRSREKRVFALEKNETGLSRLLEGAGLYEEFASYRFDSARLMFSVTEGCRMLQFLRKKPFITASDMVSAKRSQSGGGRQPEFYEDYRDLWARYRQNPLAWKLLCGALAERAAQQDLIAGFRKKPASDKTREAARLRYLLPFACSRSVSRILDFLLEQEIAEKGSRVEAFTTGACEVTILDRCGCRDQYDRLFANVYALMDPDAISLFHEPKSRMVRVEFDDLCAEQVLITGNQKSQMRSLLKYFQEKGYLLRMQEQGEDLVRFTYATREIKELLTTAGKMLEVYIFHKARETGRFDDVVSSFEIEWEGEEDIKNEFDCILTRGFQTLFVECKARPEIEQNYYFKIAQLVRQFGINARAVLIADTQEKEGYAIAGSNALQRKRGNMMGVITVWKREEIENIGETLLKILNGSYDSGEEDDFL